MSHDIHSESVLALAFDEGRMAGHQVVHEDSKCPPVYHEVIAISFPYLRCHVLVGAAKGFAEARGEFGGKTEVGQLNVTFFINQHILWFKVSIDISIFVNELQDHDQLTRVKARFFLREGHSSVLVEEQVPSLYVVHHKVHPFSRLEGVVQLDNKRMLECDQSLLLMHDVVFLVFLLDGRLPDYFHRIVKWRTRVPFLFNQANFGVASHPDNLLHFKHGKVDVLVEVVKILLL